MVNQLFPTGQAQDNAKVKETIKINEIRHNRVKLTIYSYSQAAPCHKECRKDKQIQWKKGTLTTNPRKQAAGWGLFWPVTVKRPEEGSN